MRFHGCFDLISGKHDFVIDRPPQKSPFFQIVRLPTLSTQINSTSSPEYTVKVWLKKIDLFLTFEGVEVAIFLIFALYRAS